MQNKMLRSILLVCLTALAGSKDLEKRQLYGVPLRGSTHSAAPAGYRTLTDNFGSPADTYGVPSSPGPEASFSSPSSNGGVSGGKCRASTQYVLTWTSSLVPVTVYSTATKLLSTTLYEYVTATATLPRTEVRLATQTQRVRGGHQEETRIQYRTATVTVPQVEVVTSTLQKTEVEHVTVTETDVLTQTQLQRLPVEVTATSVLPVPQIITSVVTEYRTERLTDTATSRFEVASTRTVHSPREELLTTRTTLLNVLTVRLTRTQQNVHSVTQCGYQRRF